MVPLLLLLLYTPVVCALEVWEITLIAGSGSLVLLLALYACTVMRMTHTSRTPVPIAAIVVEDKKAPDGKKVPDGKKGPDGKKVTDDKNVPDDKKVPDDKNGKKAADDKSGKKALEEGAARKTETDSTKVRGSYRKREKRESLARSYRR